MQEEKYKIAILGGYDNSVLGFKGVGVDVCGLNEENAKEQAEEILNNKNYAIIFITEDWAGKLESVLEEYKGRALPAIVNVPSLKGSTGAALKNLKKIVEQAVGSDILFNEK